MPHDTYGIEEHVARAQLDTFLHETLHDPRARLEDLAVRDGHWEARVAASERRISGVFLLEHAGKIVPGHMTEDAHPRPELPE